jgi:hypothetical protein
MVPFIDDGPVPHPPTAKADAHGGKLNVILPRHDLREGEVLNLLGIWRGASFADVNQQTGFGEPGKGAPHGNQNTCFAAHA